MWDVLIHPFFYLFCDSFIFQNLTLPLKFDKRKTASGKKFIKNHISRLKEKIKKLGGEKGKK